MLEPLPFTHSDRLVVLEEQVAEFRDIYPKLPVTANHFVNWERNSHSFQSMAAIEQKSVPLGTDEHPIQVKVVRATSGIFSVLGATPQIGRPFAEQEAQPGRDRVVALMNDLWRTQFQSDPAILGKTVRLDGFPYTVIRVMPRSFHLPVTQDLANNTDRAKPVEALMPQVFTPDLLAGAMSAMNADRPATAASRISNEVRVSPPSAMTASAMSEERDRCLAAGMDDFISKPVSYKVIEQMIMATLSQRE
jgi:CheY-like chemotaxis protein